MVGARVDGKARVGGLTIDGSRDGAVVVARDENVEEGKIFVFFDFMIHLSLFTPFRFLLGLCFWLLLCLFVCLK